MSAFATNPASIDMATTDTIPLSVDLSALLSTGDSVTNVSLVFKDLQINRVISLSAFTQNGNVITQVIPGNLLKVHGSYRVTIVFTANTNKIFTVITDVNCVL